MDIENPLDRFSKATLFKSVLIVSVAWLLIGVGLDGYNKTKLQNEVLCLSCLALEPVPGDFEGYWVEHPETGKVPKHPDWVKDELDRKKVLFVFRWDYGCKGCDRQWEEMQDDGLVKGEKSDAELLKYTESLILLSLRESNDEDERGKEAGDVYDPRTNTPPGNPISVFLTRADGDPDTIYWWAAEGKMDASDVDLVINAGIDK